MLITEFAETLIKVGAPILGSLIGSPLAGAAISLLASHFDVAPQENHNDWLANIAKAVNDNPEKLKQLENQHQEAILEIMEQIADKAIDRSPVWMAGIIAFIVAIAAIFAIGWLFMNGAMP